MWCDTLGDGGPELRGFNPWVMIRVGADHPCLVVDLVLRSLGRWVHHAARCKGRLLANTACSRRRMVQSI